jgi:hypothetical protein
MKIVNSFATIYENISHPSDISGLFEIRDDHQARCLAVVFAFCRVLPSL